MALFHFKRRSEQLKLEFEYLPELCTRTETSSENLTEMKPVRTFTPVEDLQAAELLLSFARAPLLTQPVEPSEYRKIKEDSENQVAHYSPPNVGSEVQLKNEDLTSCRDDIIDIETVSPCKQQEYKPTPRRSVLSPINKGNKRRRSRPILLADEKSENVVSKKHKGKDTSPPQERPTDTISKKPADSEGDMSITSPSSSSASSEDSDYDPYVDLKVEKKTSYVSTISTASMYKRIPIPCSSPEIEGTNGEGKEEVKKEKQSSGPLQSSGTDRARVVCMRCKCEVLERSNPRTSRVMLLLIHVKSHSQRKQFKCSACDYTSDHQIQRHVRKTHPKAKVENLLDDSLRKEWYQIGLECFPDRSQLFQSWYERVTNNKSS